MEDNRDKEIKKRKNDLRKKNRIIGIMILIFIFLLICFLVLFYFSRKKEKLEFDMTKTREYHGYKNEYFFIKDKKLYAYRKNKPMYVIKVEEDSQIEVDKDNIYFSLDNILCIFNRKNAKEVYKLDLSSKIYNLEKRGKNLIIYMENSLGLLADGNKKIKEFDVEGIAIGYAEGDNTNIISLDKNFTFNFYMISPSDKNIMDMSTKEALVFNRYISGKEHLLASKNAIYLYNGDKLTNRVDLQDLRGIYIGNGKIFLIDKQSLYIYDGNLQLIDKKDLDFDPLKVIYNDGKIYIRGKDQIYIYSENFEEGMEKVKAKDFIFNGEDIYFIYEDGIERY